MSASSASPSAASRSAAPPTGAVLPPAEPPQARRGRGWRAGWDHAARLLERAVPHTLLALACRISIAAIFLQSGRTKVDGWLTVNENAVALFVNEYRLPVLPPALAAHLATYAEHLFPLLLVLGLFTRLSALGLLAMTLTIQVFVYPDAWPTHLSWAAVLLYLVAKGAGPLSADRALGIA